MLTPTARRPLPRAATLLATGLLLAAPLVASGCSITRSRTHVESSGNFIGDQTISRITPGKTDKEWVLAVLGPPSTKASLKDNTELWKWQYSRVRTSSGSVLFVTSTSGRDEQVRNVYVEFDGEIVRQVWRD